MSPPKLSRIMIASFLLQLCSLDITNYGGDVINPANYLYNTESFKISAEYCSEIKVNGEIYNTSKGFYDFGTYTISSNDISDPITVKINEVPENKRNYYKVTANNGVQSIMLSVLDTIVDKPAITSYFNVVRQFVLNFTKFKTYYPNVTVVGVVNTSVCVDYIRNVSHSDPFSFFYIVVDDQRPHFLYKWLLENGIHESRYKFIMISDGQSTYSEFSNLSKMYEYENWLRYTKDIDSWMNKTKNGEISPFSLNYFVNNYAAAAYPIAMRNNVELWLTLPEAIVSDDEKVQNEINQSKMFVSTLHNYWNRMNETQKKIFLDIVEFDPDDFKNKYMKEKPLIIILGTHTDIVWGKDGKNFLSYLYQTQNDFKDYQLMYKPHPQTPINDAMKKYFKKNNIYEFDLRIPIDVVIMTLGTNISYGGYESTSYIITKPHQTKFFYTDDLINLSAPFQYMYYHDLLGTPKFYQYAPIPTPPPEKHQHSFVWVYILITAVIIIAAIIVTVIVVKSKKRKTTFDVDPKLLLAVN